MHITGVILKLIDSIQPDCCQNGSKIKPMHGDEIHKQKQRSGVSWKWRYLFVDAKLSWLESWSYFSFSYFFNVLIVWQPIFSLAHSFRALLTLPLRNSNINRNCALFELGADAYTVMMSQIKLNCNKWKKKQFLLVRCAALHLNIQYLHCFVVCMHTWYGTQFCMPHADMQFTISRRSSNENLHNRKAALGINFLFTQSMRFWARDVFSQDKIIISPNWSKNLISLKNGIASHAVNAAVYRCHCTFSSSPVMFSSRAWKETKMHLFSELGDARKFIFFSFIFLILFSILLFISVIIIINFLLL